MWRQNIILLVAAFLTTIYGKAHKYVCTYNTLLAITYSMANKCLCSTLKPEVLLSNISKIRTYSHSLISLLYSLVDFEKHKFCISISEELW
jgi:hypothetical protein